MLPRITPLHIPKIIDIANKLPSYGKLEISKNNLIYLDITNDFVHQLFPLINNNQVQKPNYFGEASAGAHITVIYPEEKILINNVELGKEHNFRIKKLVVAEIGHKNYYVLIVESPSLLKIRRKYGLPDQLYFKSYLIDFHITLGVSFK